MTMGMTPEEQNHAKERMLRLKDKPQLICGEYTTQGYPHPDKLLERIRSNNLTDFAVTKTALALLPILDVENTRAYISKYHPSGKFTFINLPWVNHGSQVMLRDTPEEASERMDPQRLGFQNTCGWKVMAYYWLYLDFPACY